MSQSQSPEPDTASGHTHGFFLRLGVTVLLTQALTIGVHSVDAGTVLVVLKQVFPAPRGNTRVTLSAVTAASGTCGIGTSLSLHPRSTWNLEDSILPAVHNILHLQDMGKDTSRGDQTSRYGQGLTK